MPGTAKSRKHPTQLVRAGQPERCEFEYVRHGTASLIAALDVATGKVTAADVTRDDSAHFIKFLEQIDESNDPGLAVHVVIDNGSSHRSKATKNWFSEHPRFVVHHTPVHASWLNQIEAFFSILTRKVLRRSEFDSRTELVQRMLTVIEHPNTTATSFKWVYNATRPVTGGWVGLASVVTAAGDGFVSRSAFCGGWSCEDVVVIVGCLGR